MSKSETTMTWFRFFPFTSRLLLLLQVILNAIKNPLKRYIATLSPDVLAETLGLFNL